MNRKEVLLQACEQCLKELYSRAQPAVTWEDFQEQNKEYNKKYKEWHLNYNQSMGAEPSLRDYCGPAPCEFYYLPSDIFKDICDSYISAYKIDNHQNLLDIIQILKGYCLDPIVDKYIPGENGYPGYRGYEHPDNLVKELTEYLSNWNEYDKACEIAESLQNRFFEFLDMAGEFYTWNSDLNLFNTEVYLGASPTSNKEKVIENWKLYRDKDIKIDDSIYIEED